MKSLREEMNSIKLQVASKQESIEAKNFKSIEDENRAHLQTLSLDKVSM